jgi:hypothetical protein
MDRPLPAPSPARLLAFAILAAFASGCSDDNRPPSLGLLTDQQVVVGNTFRVILSASDPDGDRLTFRASGLPDGAQITPLSLADAVLVWSPSITDTTPGGRRYDVDVTVDDGRGGRSSQRLGLVVYPTFGTPTFDLPAGVVLNLATDDALDLVVTLKDDDSTNVTIDLSEAPTGARLQMTDPKVAQFYWEPDQIQRDVAVHRAIFVARDDANTTTTHVLTIILMNAEKQSGCAGQPPTINHAPLADSRPFGPIDILANAFDGQSQVESMTIHWTLGDPNGAYTAAPMPLISDDGDAFSTDLDVGTLPSQGALLHYFLVATDNDDPTGLSCDQSARLPKSGVFTAAVYPQSAPSNACLDVDEPDDSPQNATAISQGTHAGRRICAPDTDLYSVDAPTGSTLVATLNWSAAQGDLELALVDDVGSLLGFGPETVPGTATLSYERVDNRPIFLEVTGRGGGPVSYAFELGVGTARCEDDASEPDSTPDAARPLASASGPRTLCPGDSDFFSLQLPAGSPTRISLAFDHRYGDLDLELRAADGVTVLARSASEKSLEEIVWDGASSTTGILRVYGIEGATNGYTLSAASDASLCPPDNLGDNRSAEVAAILLQDAYEGFITCPGVPDWFAIDLNDNERLDLLVVTDDASRGTANLRVYRDPSAPPIVDRPADGSGFADTQIVASGPERLYYEIYTSTPNPVTYALLQEVSDPPGACRPDRFEPNAIGSPTTIPSGIHTWLRLCGDNDTDVFNIEVPAFTPFIAFTDHAPGESYTDLELRSPSGALLADETDLGEGAYIELFLEQAGTYTLYVKPYDIGQGLGYDLGVFLD